MLQEFKCGITCPARRSVFSQLKKKKQQKTWLRFLLASLTPSGHHLWVCAEGKKGQENEDN